MGVAGGDRGLFKGAVILGACAARIGMPCAETRASVAPRLRFGCRWETTAGPIASPRVSGLAAAEGRGAAGCCWAAAAWAAWPTRGEGGGEGEGARRLGQGEGAGPGEEGGSLFSLFLN